MRLPAFSEHLLTELKARYEIETRGMVAGVRARLDERLVLEPLSVDADLAERRGRLGIGRVRTWAFQSERLRKLVLTEVNLWPLVEGFALTLLPRPEVAAPVFEAAIMLLPTRLSADADVYGAAEDTRGWLGPLHETFARLGGDRGPRWAKEICVGEGLHARVSPRLVGEANGAFGSALGAYLDALAEAPTSTPTEADRVDSRRASREQAEARFFRLFHENGPRTGPLRHLFGENWAERYSRLAFE